jgi:hypothetical protein
MLFYNRRHSDQLQKPDIVQIVKEKLTERNKKYLKIDRSKTG